MGTFLSKLMNLYIDTNSCKQKGEGHTHPEDTKEINLDETNSNFADRDADYLIEITE